MYRNGVGFSLLMSWVMKIQMVRKGCMVSSESDSNGSLPVYIIYTYEKILVLNLQQSTPIALTHYKDI